MLSILRHSLRSKSAGFMSQHVYAIASYLELWLPLLSTFAGAFKAGAEP
jgi:hypothetical protein